MQHSINFNLNLVEQEDTFSANPISENATSVDESMKMAYVGMKEEQGQRTAADAALDQRVTALEVHKICAGTYTGTGSSLTIEVGFTPVAALLSYRDANSRGATLVTPDGPAYTNTDQAFVTITEGGFRIAGGGSYNTSGSRFNFIAFA